ncbi:MAG: hypothetical protein KTR32_07130 [Granulosicoccus sp.]|nr:hypothetical protein [Granulosicoccus sp.]
MNRPLPWIAVILAIMLTGCSAIAPVIRADVPSVDFSTNDSLAFSSTNRSRVALDLVNTLRQVDGYAPGDAVLDITRLQGPFGDSLIRVLAAKGYRSSAQSQDVSSTPVELSVRPGKSRNQTTAILRAGAVKIKRDYQLIDGYVQPASYMFIKGAPADNIEPDDSIFISRTEVVIPAPVSNLRSG